MKLIILAVLAVVAATRADYHDDVFHFSTLRSPVTLSHSAQQQQSAYRQPTYASYYQQQPAAYSHQYYQHAAQYPQYTPAATQYVSGQYTPAATHYVSSQYTPAVTQYVSGQYTPATTQYVSGQYTPAATQYVSGQYTPAATHYVSGQYTPAVVAAGYYQHQPNVLLQSPVQTVTKSTVYQPAVYSSQVPATTTYSSLGGLGGVHATGSLRSLYGRSAAAYAPAYSGPQYRILKQVQEVDPSGPYRMHYVTENGISASEEGSLVAAPEGPAVAKHGSYSYPGPDGVQYTVNWVADENGFRASGAHLPQAPEVAAVHAVEAQRSLYYPSTQYAFLQKK